MSLTLSVFAPQPRLARRILRGGCAALWVAVVVVLSGCGSKEGTNVVTGKVTLKDSPVHGSVTFVYSDGKEVNAPTNPTDGTYTFLNPAPGKVKVLVKAIQGGSVAPMKDAGKALTKDAPTAAGPQGSPPPPKYGAVATSGLDFEVKGGKQVYDIPLDK